MVDLFFKGGIIKLRKGGRSPGKKGERKMAYVRKTVDRWDIMGNYGFGWECDCSEYTRKEAAQRLKEYRENDSGAYRLEKHREKKEVL